ncbi:MAG: DUF134 domain-containing protein [Desulfotomaculaceae bacterium]|nr:DUF134 domain-containing protein [Desulfotomaculaceae bacterium]
MPRPQKCRRVEQLPGFTCFKPSGIPLTELDEVIMSVEEIEAIRLRELLVLEYEECAEKMAVSRPTFHRILAMARQKIAFALINGSALRISGGNFQLAQHKLECRRCGFRWEGTVCCRRTVCPACSENDWQENE